MKRLKGFFSSLAIVLLLAIGLGIWIALPWFAVLAIAAAIALWLYTTRSGRLAREATKIGLAGPVQRWGASSVIVVGIAGVVGVLVAMLAMGEGFKATLKQTGSDDTAIVLRGGSQAETNSVITRDQVPLISTLAGIAKDKDGRALLSPELSQIVNLPTVGSGEDANAQFRGVSEAAWAIRPHIKLIEGRKFNIGVREIVVGQGAKGQYRGLEIGKTLRLGNQDWTVVGVFAAGDATTTPFKQIIIAAGEGVKLIEPRKHLPRADEDTREMLRIAAADTMIAEPFKDRRSRLLSTVPHDETRLSALREAAALADGYEVLTIAGIAFTAEEVQLIEREMVPA